MMQRTVVLKRHLTIVSRPKQPDEQVVSYFVTETINTLNFTIGEELTEKLVQDLLHTSEIQDHQAYEVIIR